MKMLTLSDILSNISSKMGLKSSSLGSLTNFTRFSLYSILYP